MLHPPENSGPGLAFGAALFEFSFNVTSFQSPMVPTSDFHLPISTFVLVIRIWDLEFIWFLVLGICDLFAIWCLSFGASSHLCLP